jgi:hypothetical protein
MKKSEQLRVEAGSIESDIKYLGAANKIMREERIERFEEEWLPLLKEKATVHYSELLNRYWIENKKMGVIDFYPKANKILIRKENRWVKPGLQWLIKNFELK